MPDLRRAAAVACALVAVAAAFAGLAQAATPLESPPGFRALPGTHGGFVAATPYGEARLLEGGVTYTVAEAGGSASVQVRFEGGEHAAPTPVGVEGPGGFAAVLYADLRPGVDLAYRATSAGVKYEYRLAPGVPTSWVQVRVAGTAPLVVDGDGSLVMSLGARELRDSAPAAFQGERIVACRFALSGTATYGFACEGVDPAEPLTIDPLVFSTLVGGSSYNYEYPLALDASGEMILTGATYSADFPNSTGAFDRSPNGDADVTLTKLTAQGDAVVFSTFFGGSSYDNAMGLTVDAAGNIYVVGTTYSSDFPVTNGSFDTSFNGYYWYYGDAFAAKFNATGALVWCTYLGGSSDDAAFAVAVDGAGAVYVFGVTSSTNLPSTNQAWDGSADGGWDTFVAKLSANGSKLEYLTYLGGAADDRPARIAVDGAGDAFVVGNTLSTDFPTTSRALSVAKGGGQDAFAAEVSPTAGSLVYSTFIGGQGDDAATGLVLMGDGSVVIGGWTGSADFPTTVGALDRNVSAVDAFALRLSAAGDSLDFSTVVGGNGNDYAMDLKLDAFGEIYLAGYTSSSVDFPVTSSTDDPTFNGGTYDAFLVRLAGNASKLLFATFLGGAYDDYGLSLAVASPFVAYVSGYTGSPSFPTTAGAFDRVFSGYVMAFIAGTKSAYRAHYDTWPPGLNVTVDSQAFATPADIPCWVGSLRRISAPTVQVVGSYRYTFASWNHSVSQSHVLSCTADGSFVASFSTEFLLTFNSNSAGALVRVDDRSYFTPYTRWCARGANVSLNVSTPQVANATRYTFSGWSDGLARAHTLSCAAPTALWANFTTEFLVSVDTAPSALGVALDGANQTAPLSYWCAAGTLHTLETSPLQEVAGTRYGFEAWSDAGPRVRTLACTAPLDLTATFGPVSHLLSFLTDPPGLQVTVEGGAVGTPYAFWCVHAATAHLSVPSGQELGGVRFAFRAWSFNATGGADQPVVCGGPLTVTASLAAEAYRVRLTTAPAGLQLQLGPAVLDTPAESWCAVGSSFIVGAPSPQTQVEVREVFANWSDGRPQSHAAACAGPANLTASFTTQYRLAVATTPAGLAIMIGGAVVMDGQASWCDAGAAVALAPPPLEASASTRHPFEGWADAGGANRTIACDGSRALAASFGTEHRAVLATVPPGLLVRADNTTSPSPLVLWWSAGSLHEVEFGTPQTLALQSFSFENWSDGGLPRHSVRADGPLELTAFAVSGGLPDFRLAIAVNELIVEPGAAASLTVRVEPVNNYAAPDLTVTATDLPDGVDVRCAPQRLPAGASCTLEVRVAPGVPPGDYAFTLRADNGTQVRASSVTLHVSSQKSFSTTSAGGSVLPFMLVLAVFAAGAGLFMILLRRRKRGGGAPNAAGTRPEPSGPVPDPWLAEAGPKRP